MRYAHGIIPVECVRAQESSRRVVMEAVVELGSGIRREFAVGFRVANVGENLTKCILNFVAISASTSVHLLSNLDIH